MPRPRLCVSLAVVMLLPSALPDRAGAQDAVPDSVAPEDPAQDSFLNAIELLRDPSHVRDHPVSRWLEMLAAAGLAGECRGAWRLAIDFDDWVARMATPPPIVAVLRGLLAEATEAVRDGLGVRSGEGFEIPIALFVATHAGSPARR